MEKKGMKKEGAVGLLLIAIIIVVAVLMFLPKDLESALGSGFAPAEVKKVSVTLTPTAGGDQLTREIPTGDEDFPTVLALLQSPSYSRTHAQENEVTLDYQVSIRFADEEGWAWEYDFSGGKLIQAGTTDKLRSYQISDGQSAQQKILDGLLELVEKQ